MRTRRTLQSLLPLFRPVLFLVLVLMARVPVPAITCTVPGSHLTIQAAVDDLACIQIDLVDQTYTESIHVPRSLTITGPGAGTPIIEGLVQVVGSGALVTLVDLQVRNGCQHEALSVAEAARVEGTGLEVVRSAALPCPPITRVFADGFESGDTTAWSGAVQ